MGQTAQKLVEIFLKEAEPNLEKNDLKHCLSLAQAYINMKDDQKRSRTTVRNLGRYVSSLPEECKMAPATMYTNAIVKQMLNWLMETDKGKTVHESSETKRYKEENKRLKEMNDRLIKKQQEIDSFMIDNAELMSAMAKKTILFERALEMLRQNNLDKYLDFSVSKQETFNGVIKLTKQARNAGLLEEHNTQ